MVKLGTYAAISTLAAVGAVYHAFGSREQFYPAMVYLATSKISLLLLLNMGLVVMCSIWQLLKLIFLGTLREIEVERLNEQAWREVMEILFAMTIFREEFNVSFVGMVTVLLFIKAFHWLAQKRVEYIETTPAVSRLSHARVVSFMLLLSTIDLVFLQGAVSHLLKTKRPSVALFFAFEYVILATSTVSMLFKYGVYMGDMLMEGRWESKAVYVFYLELVRDLLHLSLYLVFFLVIFINYGLPLHLVRELYETFRNFKARVADFVRYKKVTSNMNERFPDATAEELGRSDATCIICREEMMAAKKLLCGHLFHVHCLRSWLERQQTCPTCRSPVLAPQGGSAARSFDHAANPAQRHPQGQSSQEGQGLATSEGQHQASGSVNRTHHQHQARMQAAAMAAAQYGSSFVYPAMVPGCTNWYLTYVPLPPQQYLFAVPTPTGGSLSPRISAHDVSRGNESSTQGGMSADAVLETAGQQTNESVAQGASSNQLEQSQLLQVRHRIEILQNQLKWAINLQNKLAALRPRAASDLNSFGATFSSDSQESVPGCDQSSFSDRKGKAPEVNKNLGDTACSCSTSDQANELEEISTSLLASPHASPNEE